MRDALLRRKSQYIERKNTLKYDVKNSGGKNPPVIFEDDEEQGCGQSMHIC